MLKILSLYTILNEIYFDKFEPLGKKELNLEKVLSSNMKYLRLFLN
jgi:hypothetical protein